MQKLLAEVTIPDTVREAERKDLALRIASTVETFLRYRSVDAEVAIDRDELDHHKPWLIEGRLE